MLQAGPVISEFLAQNNTILKDEDQDYSDWIEIYNPTASDVELEGWYLTDNEDNLTKWRIPDVTLGPDEALVVFASEKDRDNPAGELHTNFKLSGGGEYLALVERDGFTVAWAYAPEYPDQLDDVSYGLRQWIPAPTLVPVGAPATVLVPQDDLLGTTWTAIGFDDSGWTAGTTGVGYDLGSDYDALIETDLQGQMYGTGGSAYVRIPFDVADPAALDRLLLRMKYDDGFVAYLNGEEVARRNAPAAPAWDSTATAEHGHADPEFTVQDFDAPGTPYTPVKLGSPPGPRIVSGGPSGDFLRLVRDGVNNNVNRIAFDQVLDGPADVVVADFDVRFTSDEDAAADGLAFILLPTSIYGSSGPGSDGSYVSEEPNLPGTFAVGFDLHPADTVNDVSAHWDGNEAINVRVPSGAIDLDAGVFHHAHVELTRDGSGSRVTVTLTPDVYGTPGEPVVAIDDLFIAGLVPYESRVEFSARTGGRNMDVDLDNIAVRHEPAGAETAFEEIDLTAYLGVLEPGPNVLAIHGLNIDAGDDDLLVLPELAAAEARVTDLDVQLYFLQPTPGEPNSDGSLSLTEPVQFSRAGGVFTEPFSLSLSTDSPEAVIYYTQDGSIPTESSPEYTGPIWIDATMRIRARAFETGLAAGPLASASYLELDASAAAFDSNLPLVVVDTFGATVGTGDFTSVYSVFIDTETDGRADITGAVDFSGLAGLKLRGSSSLGFPKKQYAFETRDEYGDDRSVSLLGLPRESDWVLYAPYSDKTLMRNYLSYLWSNRIGRYAPRTQFVEMFLNADGGPVTADDYVGVYLLVEKIKRDDDRVDITGLTPADFEEPGVTGGYIIKKDRLDPGDEGFLTSSGQRLAYVDPKEDEITPEQAAWLKGYLDAFEAALYGPDFTDPEVGYAAYIDVDSFIDHHILVELTKNIDGFRLSTFFYKDREGKLNAGPIWDYNLSLGNANYLTGWEPEGWYWDQLSDDNYPWYRRLFEDPDFQQRYIDRWTELRRELFTTETLLADIDSAAALLDEAQVRNFERWPVLGQYVWPNWFIGETYGEEIDFMKGWLVDRLDWIDSQYLAPVALSQDGGLIDASFELFLSAPAGTIYYTLDGNDPRLSGGAVSPGALIGHPSLPVIFGGNTRVMARAFDSASGRWSGLMQATFVFVSPLPLEITEVMYHPSEPPPDSLFVSEDFEFIELRHAGTQSLNLVDAEFADGIGFTFQPLDVAPGEYVVVVKNREAFASRYGAEGITIAGEFTGQLSNGGEAIWLVDAIGASMAQFAYNDGGPWPGRADGKGASLEAIDPAGDLNDPDNWRSSTEYAGTPGRAGIGPVIDILVNEVLTHTDEPDLDAIELLNTTGDAIDIGGWYLSDSSDDYHKFRIPDGTILDAAGRPGAYRVFDEDDFNASGGLEPNDFALDGAHGDDVWLMAAEGDGRLTRFVDHVEFGAAANGESFGRWPNGGGELYPMSAVTLGETNSGPRVGPLVISELMYNPPDPGGDVTPEDLEYIEIYNPTAATVDLDGWQLRGGIGFDFAPGTLVEPSGVLVVVRFDPDDPENAELLSTFRATYGIAPEVALVGGYSGRLDNGGETVRLLEPDDPPPDELDFTPMLLEDMVIYEDDPPWPGEPDGTGPSLDRVTPRHWANDPASWLVAEPSPGSVLFASLDVDDDGSADALTDGVLILRYLFGFTGLPLVEGALAPGAARTDPQQVVAFLDRFRDAMLDVDANGRPDALTDGVIALRHLFGFTGPALVEGVLAPDAARIDAEEIEAFLTCYMPIVAGMQGASGIGDSPTTGTEENAPAVALAYQPEAGSADVLLALDTQAATGFTAAGTPRPLDRIDLAGGRYDPPVQAVDEVLAASVPTPKRRVFDIDDGFFSAAHRTRKQRRAFDWALEELAAECAAQ